MCARRSRILPADPNIQSILPCILPIDRRLSPAAFFFPFYIGSCSISRDQKRAPFPSPFRKWLHRGMDFFTSFFSPFFHQIDAIFVRMKKRTRIYNIYYSVVSCDFVTPTCSVVMFSNVPINSSLEAGIVLRQINAKDCPPTDTQRNVVTRVNKGCCARCTTHVARMTCMEKKSHGFSDGNWSSGTRSSDYFLHCYGYARYSNVDTNYASECNYNFIQINFEEGNVLSC